MENQFNLIAKSENSQNPLRKMFNSLLGLKHHNVVSMSGKKNNISPVQEREQLFSELFGVPYTDDENQLYKIIKNKIDNLDDTQRRSINEKISNKVKEIEASLNIRKPKTYIHIFATFSLLSMALISCWFLFENDLIINMKLVLCQSAFIGFIAGFKELHYLLTGHRDVH